MTLGLHVSGCFVHETSKLEDLVYMVMVLDLDFHGFGPLERSLLKVQHPRSLCDAELLKCRKVFAAVSEPNYGVPWVYKAQDARTGTAFAVWWVKGSHLAV